MRRLMAAAALLALPSMGEEIAGAEARSFEQYLNIRSAASGTIAPDASRVAFLTNVTGTNQVWVVDAAGGWPEQITFFPDRVQLVRWSPAGDWLIFGKDAGGNEKTQLYLASPDGSSIQPLTDKPRVIHEFGAWSPDGRKIAYGSNERAEAFFDIYVMDVGTRSAERVMTHDGLNTVEAWSPDGRALVIRRSNGSLDDDLYLLDLGTKAVTRLTPHEGKAVYLSAAWPPGDIIYVVSDQGRDFRNVAAIDIRSPRVTFVEDMPHDVESIEFSRDGRRVVVAINEDGYTRISLREGGIKGRELTAPAVPRGTAGRFEFSRDGKALLVRTAAAAEPGDIWIHDLDRQATSRVTRASLAGIPRDSFVKPELIRYRSFDGLEVPAFLYLPRTAAGGTGKVPVILLIHGGPEGQSRPGFSATDQFFVSRGYALMVPNIRGSTGYGKKYHRMDDVRLRENAIKDVAAAAHYIKGSSRLDADRIAVMGGSYGGFMTLAALTFHPDLWAAGVDIVGVSNFKSFLKNTGAWRSKHRATEYGDPEKDSEFLDRISPLNHVDRIQAPLLVIQGANDPRVPKSEADQIVDSLKRRGRPVDYIVFEDEGHGVVKLPNRIKAYTAVADFLDSHMKKGSAPSAGSGS